MNKFLKVADRVIFLFVNNVSALLTCAIFLIVTLMVIVRFVFKTSSFGFEELPTYFLMISIWMGAVICSRDPKEGQIKIDIFVNMLRGKPLLQSIIHIFTSCVSVLSMGVYGVLSWQYVAFCYETNQATVALRVPMAFLVGLTSLACTFLVIYELRILVNAVGRTRNLIRERRNAA